MKRSITVWKSSYVKQQLSTTSSNIYNIYTNTTSTT